jgi:hypothetical protein
VAYLARGGAVSPTFPAIDGALGFFQSYYIYASLNPLPVYRPGLRGPFLIDSQMCCQCLASAGFIPEKASVSPHDLLEERDLYMDEWRRLYDAGLQLTVSPRVEIGKKN